MYIRRIPLLDLLINFIPAKSAPQILLKEGECNGSCNFSANSLFKIFSFLIPLPEVFLSKLYKTLEQDLFDTPGILDF